MVDLTLDYVGDGNSLYATYANEENVIRDDADTLIVVVEDADAIAARTVGFDLATVSGLSGNDYGGSASFNTSKSRYLLGRSPDIGCGWRRRS